MSAEVINLTALLSCTHCLTDLEEFPLVRYPSLWSVTEWAVREYLYGLRFVHLYYWLVDCRSNFEGRGQNEPVHELGPVV